MGNKKTKVIIAMSGGIDSSVAAALLKKANFDVVGVFMKFWTEKNNKPNSCCTPESQARARAVARIIGIPFYVFDFQKEFKKRIVDYFLREYNAGRTPNPCVVCNKEIKFGLLLQKALALGADFVATGHYALKSKIQNPKFKLNQKSKIQKLFAAKDKSKDQSYFLWQLSQKQLKRILFPVGNYTKSQVRDLAKKSGLPFSDVKESQEICFVSDKSHNEFLKRHLRLKSGKIVDNEGKVLARHQGLALYTLGQRKGIELANGPYYVIGKDVKSNRLIVSNEWQDKNLYSKDFYIKNANWLSGKEPNLPLSCKAKIRYYHPAAGCKITEKISKNSYKVKLGKVQRAVTPGQSAVFYYGKEILGGGVIS